MTARTSHPPQYSTLWPWGKHRGERIADCPSSYLIWAFEEATMEPYLEAAVRGELSRRIGHFTPPHQWPQYKVEVPRNANPTVILGVVRAGRRACALRSHPDLGGDGADMTEINNAADALEAFVETLLVTAGVVR